METISNARIRKFCGMKNEWVKELIKVFSCNWAYSRTENSMVTKRVCKMREGGNHLDRLTQQLNDEKKDEI